MIPYTAPAITTLLRRMSPAELHAVAPSDFQRWPAKVATKAPVIRELIANEHARRAACNPIAA